VKKEGQEEAEKKEYSSRVLFGDYIHKYYYNRSIADGYTLRLIREEIETKYKLELKELLEQIKVLKQSANRKQLYSHPKFVEPMLDYIVRDVEQGRVARNDYTTGAMVICDSADQAKEMARIFDKKYGSLVVDDDTNVTTNPTATGLTTSSTTDSIAAEASPGYQVAKQSVTTHALILHDVGTKKERKDQVEAFKEGKIDILFVYNMLLTGFDAARLKKLYVGRVIKAHNLLQALTRVNRPYKSFRYGYVVDFVDIESEFEKTNQSYFDELQSELGDELENYSNLFKSEAEIETDIELIKDVLFQFDTINAEVFSQQITQIEDRAEMRAIIKALNLAKTLYNQIRLTGQYELLAKLDFRTLNALSIEANNHLALLNQREALESADDNSNLLNIALEDVLFSFRKVSESEMIIADELRETLRRTREGLAGNFDPRDPEFITLKEELERLFKKKNLAEITQEEMEANIATLNEIDAKAKEVERKNQLLSAKYANDEKYARLHKRLLEKGEPTDNERKLFEALSDFKAEADAQIAQNARILTNEAFAKAEMTRLIIDAFTTKRNLTLTPTLTRSIIALVMKEYMDEFHGQTSA
jgi:type I restriction enzyme R subunit